MDVGLGRGRVAEDAAQREKAYAAEKSIAAVRLAVVAFNCAIFQFALLSRPGNVVWLADAIMFVALIYSVVVVWAQPYRRYPAMMHAYFTSGMDAALIVAWLFATGGFDSPFYVLWYVSIVAIAFRYSYRWTLFTSAAYSLLYVCLVAALGQLPGHAADLLIRIVYVFLMAALSGAISGEVLQQARSRLEMRDLNTRLEQMVADRTAQLETANAELEAFSYSVSHDLRAPLRSMDGFSQVLLEDYAEHIDAEGQGYLQRIRSASQRMSQLIDDMLKLSRLSRAALRRSSVDLSHMAENILGDLWSAEPHRHVTQVIAKDVVADADPDLVRVVLENLVGNAWKFTTKHDSARIEFGATVRDGAPAYFVRDDGAGFDMAYAHKLFGVFQRLHSLSEFDGTGVGLATVQRIVRRHGGRIWAEAEPEQGATFYFTLGETAPRAHNPLTSEVGGQELQLA